MKSLRGLTETPLKRPILMEDIYSVPFEGWLSFKDVLKRLGVTGKRPKKQGKRNNESLPLGV